MRIRAKWYGGVVRGSHRRDLLLDQPVSAGEGEVNAGSRLRLNFPGSLVESQDRGPHPAGSMFWFIRNRFPGSQRFLARPKDRTDRRSSGSPCRARSHSRRARGRRVREAIGAPARVPLARFATPGERRALSLRWRSSHHRSGVTVRRKAGSYGGDGSVEITILKLDVWAGTHGAWTHTKGLPCSPEAPIPVGLLLTGFSTATVFTAIVLEA